MTVGLYAGSFDPVHLGHVALIETASARFERLVVVVAANTEKPSGMFRVHERVEMLTQACRNLRNVTVFAHGGLLVDMARQLGADVLVRSAGKEHVAEKQMAYMSGCDGLPTVLIPTDPSTAYISSSAVRAFVAKGAVDVAAGLVPATAEDVLATAACRHPRSRR